MAITEHTLGLLPPCPALGDLQAGSLQVRLAVDNDDVIAAQALRYRVFVEERGAHVSAEMHAAKRDWDRFDDYCDHLLVVEHAGEGAPRVVGTYRFLRREAKLRCGAFYTASEFDISAMERMPGEILELGRSCVHPDYRNRAVMQLLLRGIGSYVALHKIVLMFGCASFHGIDPEEHSTALSYLHHYHMAPPELLLKALPSRYVPMNRMPKEGINERRAFAELPALIKGYLRLGGYISDGAVIDQDYNTLDVGIVVKTTMVTDKYAQRYGKDFT